MECGKRWFRCVGIPFQTLLFFTILQLELARRIFFFKKINYFIIWEKGITEKPTRGNEMGYEIRFVDGRWLLKIRSVTAFLLVHDEFRFRHRDTCRAPTRSAIGTCPSSKQYFCFLFPEYNNPHFGTSTVEICVRVVLCIFGGLKGQTNK